MSLRRILPAVMGMGIFTYEPETVNYMAVTGIVDDATIYFPSTIYENTGHSLWMNVNTLFVGLKNAFGLPKGVLNLNTIFDAIYPVYGGTAASAKYNAMDPQDTDAALRLVPSGGVTYDGGGVTFNGSSGFMNTFWTSSAKAGVRRISYGFYWRSNNRATTQASGSWTLVDDTRIYHILNNGTVSNFTLGLTVNNYSGSTTRFQSVRVDATVQQAYVNGVMVDSQSSTDLVLSNIPFTIGARNNNNATRNLYVNNQMAFGYITGKVVITHQQMLDFHDVVDTFMSSLGRAV